MTSSIMRACLSIAIIALVVLALLIVNSGDIGDSAREIGLVIMGAVMAKFNSVFDFYFGSSDGSKAKTELMAGKPAELPGHILPEDAG